MTAWAADIACGGFLTRNLFIAFIFATSFSCQSISPMQKKNSIRANLGGGDFAPAADDEKQEEKHPVTMQIFSPK